MFLGRLKIGRHYSPIFLIIVMKDEENDVVYSTWQETGLSGEPITLHLDKPLKTETIINVDTSKFEEVVNTAARSVANEFQSSKKALKNVVFCNKKCA